LPENLRLDIRQSRCRMPFPKGGRVAASPIYDRTYDDYTELGNLYRDKLENALRARGIPVTARRDLGDLVEDMDFYGRSDNA